MTLDIAQVIIRLASHLDGSHTFDATDLSEEFCWLLEKAGQATGVKIPIDEQALADTLGQVAQRHADSLQYQADYADVL